LDGDKQWCEKVFIWMAMSEKMLWIIGTRFFFPAVEEFKKHVAKYERFDLDAEGKESEIQKIMPELEEVQ
jgi:hypothetical protein